jgi:hypothetical protein
MNELTLEQITALQKQYGLTELQELINSGECWLREGHVGRTAMSALESGACLLPEDRHRDYYGTRVPSRNDLENGSKGTLGNSQAFWQKVENGEIEMFEEQDIEEQQQ